MSVTEPDSSNNQSSLSNPKEWVAKHGDVLFGYALRLIRNRQVAEDLVQDTLLAALKGRDSFAGGSSEQTWLIGILKNKVVDHYRKSSRETPLVLPELIADSDDPDYITTGPEAGSWQPEQRPQAWGIDLNDPVEQRQFWSHLERCLDSLEARLAMVYVLRDIENMEYQEVCNVLALSPTNLRVMLHRARKGLRRCLESNWIGQ